MRLASVACAVALLAAASAFGASGDPLVVTGDGVNVRLGPGTDNRIVMRVYRNQEAVEIARDGEWVRVEIADSGGQEGWIHGSLLAPGQAAPTATVQAPVRAPSAVQPAAEPAQREGDAAVAEAAPRADLPDREATALPDQDAAAGRAEVQADLVDSPVEPAAGPAVARAEVNRFKESVSYLNSRALQVAGVDLFTEVEAVDQQTVAVGITDAWQTVPPAGQRSYLNTLVDRWSAANGGESPVNVRIIGPEGEVLVEQSGP